MECLQNIIGVTENECPCLIESLTPEEIEEIKRSESGLYLDNAEGAIEIMAIEESDDCKSFAETALKAIDDARKRIMEDISILISEKTKSGKAAFKGFFGKPSFIKGLPTTKRYQYAKISGVGKTDGVMDVSEVRLILDQSLSTKVWLVKQRMHGATEIIATADVDTLANNFVNVGITATGLPLSEDGYPISYMFVWEKQGDETTKDIKLSCGCKGGDPYSMYATFTGGESDTLEDFPTTDMKYTRGFSIQAHIRCDTTRVVCRDYSSENAVALVLAWAMIYKGNELLAEKILASGEINRYTMMSREHLLGRRSRFRKEYENRMLYLKNTLRIDTSDCFVCRQNNIRVTGIVS